MTIINPHVAVRLPCKRPHGSNSATEQARYQCKTCNNVSPKLWAIQGKHVRFLRQLRGSYRLAQSELLFWLRSSKGTVLLAALTTGNHYNYLLH